MLAKWRSLRWLLPLLIVGGWNLTANRFEEGDQFAYLILTLVATAACILYLWPLSKPLRRTLPHWAIFTILYVGHFIQFYWLLLVENSNPWLSGITDVMRSETLLTVYRQGTMALSVAACLNALLMAFPRRSTQEASKRAPAREVKNSAVAALVCGVVLLVVTAVFMLRLNIGVVGLDTQLPFRLAGIIQYTRRITVPAFLLMVIALSDRQDSLKRYFWLTVVIMGLDAAADIVVGGTRAPLVVFGIRLFILFVVQQSLTLSRIQIVTIAVIATAAAFPFISRLRDYRSVGVNVAESVDLASESSSEDAESAGTKFALLGRFSGASSLLPIVAYQARVPGVVILDGLLGSGDGVTGFNTRQVAGYSMYDKMGVAPSLLGWFYLVGGEAGQFLGVMAVFLLAHWLWNKSNRSRIRVRPAAQAVGGTLVFQYLTEGNLEGLFLPAGVAIVSFVALEWMLWAIERRTTNGGSERWAS